MTVIITEGEDGGEDEGAEGAFCAVLNPLRSIFDAGLAKSSLIGSMEVLKGSELKSFERLVIYVLVTLPGVILSRLSGKATRFTTRLL